MEEVQKIEYGLPTDAVEPLHYDITITPNLNRPLSGQHVGEGLVHIKLRVKRAVSSFSLNELHLTFKEARYSDASGAKHQPTLKYDKTNEAVVFNFPDGPLPIGEGVLSIAYNALYNLEKDERVGWMYRPYERNGVTRQAIFTQAFPCWDQPKMKATFKLSLIVPVADALTVLANTPLEKTEPVGTDATLIKHVFETTPKMSTYLVAFAIGHFDSISAIVQTPVYGDDMKPTEEKRDYLIRVFTQEGKSSEGQFALKWACDAFKHFTDGFRYNYPMAKMDLISVPDLPFFGMENWGLLTFKTNVFLINEETAVLSLKQRVARLVCHEVVHQWFDLVTCEWWKYLWLQEGFARFLEYEMLQRLAPQWSFWSDFVRNIFQFMLKLDESPETHPIEATVNSPKDIKAIFDAISYGKGASVLRMVVNFVGDKLWPALAIYLRKHQYGSATTADLWAVFSEVSTIKIDEYMNDWVTNAGHPVVYFDIVDEGKSDSVTYTVEQQLCTRADMGGLSDHAIFKTGPEGSLYPLFLLLRTEGSPFAENIIITQSKATIVRPRSKGWVSLNSGATGLFRAKYSRTLEVPLHAAIRSHQLPVEERLSILLDMDAFLAYGWAKVTHLDLLRLLSAYDTQTDNFVVDAMCFALVTLLKFVRATPLLHNLRNFTCKLLAASITKDGLGLTSPANPYFAVPLIHHKNLLYCLSLARHPQLVHDVAAILEARKADITEAFTNVSGPTSDQREFMLMAGTLQLPGVYAWAKELLFRTDLHSRQDIEQIFVRSAKEADELNQVSLYRIYGPLVEDNYALAALMIKRASSEHSSRDVLNGMVLAIVNSPPPPAEADETKKRLRACQVLRDNTASWSKFYAHYEAIAAELASFATL